MVTGTRTKPNDIERRSQMQSATGDWESVAMRELLQNKGSACGLSKRSPRIHRFLRHFVRQSPISHDSSTTPPTLRGFIA